MGRHRRALEGAEYEEMRLILTFLDPIKVDNSFHCWSKTYHYNKVYEIIGEFSHPTELPFIEELDPEDFSDK